MTSETPAGLLVAMLGMAALLVLFSAASLGRITTDLWYQQRHGINGVRRAESWSDARRQVGRALIGLTFVASPLFLLVETPDSFRTSVVPWFYTAMLAWLVVNGVLDWVVLKHQLDLLASESDSLIIPIRVQMHKIRQQMQIIITLTELHRRGEVVPPDTADEAVGDLDRELTVLHQMIRALDVTNISERPPSASKEPS